MKLSSLEEEKVRRDSWYQAERDEDEIVRE